MNSYYKKYMERVLKNNEFDYTNVFTQYQHQGGSENPIFANIKIFDENNKPINIKKVESFEQSLAKQHVLPTDRVLELGARYGSVSVTINKILRNKKAHIVVEPDSRVWKALEKNRKINKCKFHIFKGIVATKKYSLTNTECWDGYATTMVEDENSNIAIISLNELLKKYNVVPNVLVVDCEGCFEIFVDENKDFVKNLRMIMYEADYVNKCNYVKLEELFLENGYKVIDVWSNQYIWKKIGPGETVDKKQQLDYLMTHRKRLKMI